jgi:hypothetical protein
MTATHNVSAISKLHNASILLIIMIIIVIIIEIIIITRWTVWGLNPGGGEIFRTSPDRPWGLPSLLYNGYRVIPGGKAAGTWR